MEKKGQRGPANVRKILHLFPRKCWRLAKREGGTPEILKKGGKFRVFDSGSIGGGLQKKRKKKKSEKKKRSPGKRGARRTPQKGIAPSAQVQKGRGRFPLKEKKGEAPRPSYGGRT